MTEADRNWCMDTAILEVERDCDSKDYLVVLSRNALSSDRPAAGLIYHESGAPSDPATKFKQPFRTAQP